MYENALGYRVVEVLPAYYTDGEGALLMEKQLA